MKRMAISNIQNRNLNSDMIRDKLYHIYLGNDQTVYFGNIKLAKRYLVQLNSFLNRQLVEINNISIYIFIDYRKMAIIYNEYFMKDNYTHELLMNIDRFFIKSVSQTCSLVNRNSFYFSNILKLIGYLIELCNVLIRIIKKKRTYYYDQSLKCNIKRLEEIKESIEKYGIEEQNKAPKCFYDHRTEGNKPAAGDDI